MCLLSAQAAGGALRRRGACSGCLGRRGREGPCSGCREEAGREGSGGRELIINWSALDFQVKTKISTDSTFEIGFSTTGSK